jgi:3-oxoacyl-[acyl-carrier-protein] synthase II
VVAGIAVTGHGLLLAAAGPIEDARARIWPAPLDGDRTAALARRTAESAWSASRCDAAPDRIGSTVTASKLGLGGLLRAMDAAGSGTISAEAWLDFFAPRLNPDFVHGPVVTTIGACATGLCSWIRAAQLLEGDHADAVLAGAAEGTLEPLVIAGFDRMGVLSRTRPRPFDRRRDGFVAAEGAGIVVLERDADARARGVRPLARLLGWALAGDASHPVSTSDDGAAIERLALRALASAELDADELDYIHLHGTGTRQNDVAESAALRRLFDNRGNRVPASSTKALTGHCLGAAGAVEAILTVEALRARRAPRNTGLEELDEACRTECLLRDEEVLEGGIGLVLSYGFGGSMAAVIIEAEGKAPENRAEGERAA